MKRQLLNNRIARFAVALFLGSALLLTANNSAWAGNRWGHGHRDKEIVIVKELPRGYRTVHYKKHRYYVHGDRYYRHSNRGYVRCAPPVGAVVAGIPSARLALMSAAPSIIRTRTSITGLSTRDSWSSTPR